MTLFSNITIAQNSTDSLKTLIKNRAQNDSVKLDLYLQLASAQKYTNFVEAELYASKAYQLSLTLKNKDASAMALKIRGIISDEKGKYGDAIDYYLKSISYLSPKTQRLDIAKNEANIGIIYRKLRQNKEAIQFFENSIKVMKEENFHFGVMVAYQNIGLCYIDLKNFDKAEKNLFEALKIKEEQKFPESKLYGNIGIVFESKKDYKKAIEYYTKALSENDLSNSNGATPVKDQVWINNLSRAYRLSGNLPKSLELSKQSISLLGENIYTYEATFTFMNAVEIHQLLGDYKTALYFHRKVLSIKDSIYKLETTDQIARMKEAYDAEKKDLEISALNEKNKADQIELIASKKEKSYLLGGMVILSLLGAIILRGYFQKRKSNALITAQNKSLELKNKEILDSINYAKRLQDAILPPKKLVKSYLNESFIIYRPKDIVAGDFYFVDVVENSSKKYIFYATADCTGHGVPGAMVSIVGANGLKRCIQELKMFNPGEILDKLTLIIAENFAQSEEQIRDGMDIALCCLEMEDDKVKMVHYAGANIPLIVVNPNRQSIPCNAIPIGDQNGFELKADKQTVGYTENNKPFHTHSFEVENGDILYTFTDGYPDQFGGQLAMGGKKFKTSNLKRLLINIHPLNIDIQQERLVDEFDKWKGDQEQLDDVCIIGVKLL